MSTLETPTSSAGAPSTPAQDGDLWRDVDELVPPVILAKQIQFDAGIEMNRRATPPAVVNQRRVPRYSLREVNALDNDAIAQRLKDLPRNDNRPGWVKFLDLFDAPRNALVSTAVKEFAPEAYRRALVRGERDQFGVTKVYGADILRAMGVENRVVNGIGGFLVDVFTDPLTWIGGPVGGLKTAGTTGAVQISKAGQRALRTGLKAYRRGSPVVDDTTRNLIETTVATGVRLGKDAGGIDEAADLVTRGEYAAATLLGSQGRVSRGFERAGLGGLTRGGSIADDTFRSRRAAQSIEEAARIDAVKAFVGKYTNNFGIDLTRGRAGAEIAHIPFTPLTLTVPSFRVPGLGITPGRAAVLQRAAALASEGKFEQGTALMAAQRSYSEASEIAQSMQALVDERSSITMHAARDAQRSQPTIDRLTREVARLDQEIVDAQRFVDETVEQTRRAAPAAGADAAGQGVMFAGRQAGAEPSQVAGRATDRMNDLVAERDRMNLAIDEIADGNLFTSRISEIDGEIAALQARLADWNEGLTRRLEVVQGVPGALGRIDSLDDLLLVAEFRRKSFADAKHAQSMARWRDVNDLVARATPTDIAHARRRRRAIADELASVGRMDPEAAVDDVLTATRHNDELNNLLELKKQQSGIRLQSLIDLADEDLDLAEQVADAFQTAAGAASEVAALSGRSIRGAFSSDQRLIADAARQVLRINDREMGNLPFAGMSSAMVHLGQLDAAARIADVGNRVGRSLGGVGGILPQTMGAYRRAVDLAPAQGADLAQQFERGFGEFSGVRGLAQIARVHSVKNHLYPSLDELVELRLETSMRGIDITQPTFRLHEGSAGQQLLDRLTKAGILQNEALMADVDRLVERLGSVYKRLGEDAVRRGDFDNPLVLYAPVQARADAAARIRALQGATESQAVRDLLNTLMNPAEARNTDLIEFMGSDGSPKALTLMHAKRMIGMTDEEIRSVALADQQAANRLASMREDTRDFIERFAADAANPDEIEDVMRSFARPLMPFELNEMAARGDFDTLVGGRLLDQGSLFETSAMHLLSRRVASARVAEATHAFREAIEPHVLTRARLDQIDALRPSETARLATGEEIKNLGNRRFEVGGRTYRPLSMADMDQESLFVPDMVYGPEAHELLVPDTLATAIERMNDTLRPDNMAPFMSVLDRITSVWRISTLGHLSWPISNAVGNLVLVAMSDPQILINPKRAVRYVRFFRDAVRILAQRNTGGRINRSMSQVSIGGSFVPVSEITRLADTLHVSQGGVANDMMQQWLRGASGRRPVADQLPGEGITGAFRDRRTRALAEFAAARGDLPPSQIAQRVDGVRAARRAFTRGPLNNVLRAWFGVNGSIDDAFRIAYFMMQMDDGLDAASAGLRTQRALLNFGDMTSLERNVIRPLIPFYAWTRASLPNFLMRMMRDPRQISVAPKIQNAFEELFAGENRVPRWKRPRWLQETMAIQFGSDPETAGSFQLGTLLPQEAAIQVGAGLAGITGIGDFDGTDLMDLAGWAIGQAGPTAKIPFELGTQRESFTGRTIGLAEGQGDITLPQYLAGQIRWARETGIGAPGTGSLQRAFERGLLPGAARTLIGGRASPDNLSTPRRQSALRSELKQAEADLRKAASRADFRGDQTASTELRTRLLETYFNHIRRGGDPQDVPKWAREDIESLGLPAGVAN